MRSAQLLLLEMEQGSYKHSTPIEPFGFTTQTGAASTSSYKFTGREDDGSGLSYYRTRYYQPRFQRFIGEDPIGFAGGDINLYAYVGNNPVGFRDPSGWFRLAPPDQTRYPRLAQLLHRIQAAALERRKLRALRKHGLLTKQQVKECTTFGDGPLIVIEALDGALGEYRRGQELYIDSTLAAQFESCATYGLCDEYGVLMESTILHEFTHFGRQQAGNPFLDGKEAGDLFEQEGYGLDIDTVEDAKTYLRQTR